MARPRKELTDKEIKQLEKLAGYMTQEQIADFFDMSLSTFKKLKQRDDRVLSHYNKGKAMAIYEVANSLLEQAKKGNLKAIIFYLKTRGGWSEKPAIDHQSSDNSMSQPKISILKFYQDAKDESEESLTNQNH